MTPDIRRRQMLNTGIAWSCLAAMPSFAATPGRIAASGCQAAIDEAVDSGDVPGVVAQVWHRGSLVWQGAAGLRDVEAQSRLQTNALFGIASMSKPVTVVLALRLVEMGRLRLDESITRLAPEFSSMRVLSHPDGPLDDTTPAARDITIEDLMTHRSGLGYGFMMPGPLGAALLKSFGFGIDSTLMPDAWLKALATLPLAYQPGERFNYGHSIDVLGFIVARALGTDLSTAMRTHLFEPLKMADTGFWVPPVKRKRLVPCYLSTEPHHFTLSNVASFTTDRPRAYMSGGQGLVSTAADYMRFARMLLRDGEIDGVQLLEPATVQRMRTNQFTDAQRRFPFLGQPFSQGFGYGVSVVTDPSAAALAGNLGSFGWPGGFGGWWQADPLQDTAALWLQECVPAPPRPDQPFNGRIPGSAALRKFQLAINMSEKA